MDLLTLKTWTPEEILATVEEGLEVKAHPEGYREALQGQTLAMLFQKTSTRTRGSFEVGMTQLGGHAMYLDWRATNFLLADLKDEAQVLSRYADGIMARMLEHEDLRQLAAGSEVPIINGCCDRYHPCQALGDLMTMREVHGNLDGVHLVYVGVRNNVCNSLIAGCTKVGVRITAVTPEVNGPAEDPDLVADARKTGLFEETLDLESAVGGADFLYTDTWVDMEFFLDPEQAAEKERRIQVFTPYQINADLLGRTKALVMHCLPAHKGYEVTAEVMAGPRCVAVDQAENRLHVQKAILMRLLGDEQE
jgi:ornithine carbamoyltransferase